MRVVAQHHFTPRLPIGGFLMGRKPSAASLADAEHRLLIYLARFYPLWITQVRLARMTLVMPGLINRALCRLMAEKKVERAQCYFAGPNPSVIYRLVDVLKRNLPDSDEGKHQP